MDTEQLVLQLVNKKNLWLFLDYDGTLAEFASTPEVIDSNPRIVDLLRRLAAKTNIRVAIISGRSLRDVQSLIPVSGIDLAGTYGVELVTADGNQILRVDHSVIRPYLDIIKPKWMEIVEGESGFYIEDKDWSLALHAKFSDDESASRVIALAREVIEQELPEEYFRILGGHKFLEAAPLLAHKGMTVDYLLNKHPFPDAQLIYIGDDDKDEEAFEFIIDHGGIAIKVISNKQMAVTTRANFTLESPAQVNAWLGSLLEKL